MAELKSNIVAEAIESLRETQEKNSQLLIRYLDTKDQIAKIELKMKVVKSTVYSSLFDADSKMSCSKADGIILCCLNDNDSYIDLSADLDRKRKILNQLKTEIILAFPNNFQFIL